MLGLDQPDFWVALGKIIWINVLLSGDNAVVIALACRSLPPRTRTWGIVLGAGVAVLLRIIFTGIVTTLLNLQGLKIAGSLALLYIAVSLIIPNNEEGESEVEAAENLWRAVRIVAVADLVMSLDNVIAIAGAAKGSWLLIGIGLATSVPLIIAGAALITALFTRFPLLVQAGAALLGWVAGEMMASDPLVVGYLGEENVHLLEYAAAAVCAVFVLAVGAWIARRKARAHRHAAPSEISAPESSRAAVDLGLKSDAMKEHVSAAASAGERKLH
jgi:YjbE family integral membrane protein